MLVGISAVNPGKCDLDELQRSLHKKKMRKDKDQDPTLGLLYWSHFLTAML